MAKYQLWSRDEYGQGSIIFTSEEMSEVLKRAKDEVTDINVNNALTTDDREKNWEAYMVMIGSSSKVKSKKRYIYAGGDPRTKDEVLIINQDGEIEKGKIGDVPDPMIRIYLGNIAPNRRAGSEEVDWYAKDARRRTIESIDHSELGSKTQFFIKKVCHFRKI